MPQFPTTRGFLVSKAGLAGPMRQQAISALLSRYWGPMYVHLLETRRLSHNDAELVTQRFLADVLLRQDWMDRVDRSTGRFRELLRQCLDEYVLADPSRAAGNGALASWDDEAPAIKFEKAWALDVLAELLRHLRDDCLAKLNPKRWDLFVAYVLDPTLNCQATPTIAELAKRTSTTSEQAVEELRYLHRQWMVLLRSMIEEYVLPSPELRGGLHELVPDGAELARDQIGTNLALEDGVRLRAELLIENSIDEEISRFRSALAVGLDLPAQEPATPASKALRDFFDRRMVDPNDGFRCTDVALLLTLWQPQDQPIACKLLTGLEGFAASDAPAQEKLAAGLQQMLSTPVRHERARGQLRCLADLLEHPRPPVDVLREAKDWARCCREGAGKTVGAAYATVIYYACIAAAMVRCGKSITKLAPDHLVGGFDWCLQQPWMDQRLNDLFHQARQRLMYTS